MFINLDKQEEKLVDGLYQEDEDFSAIQPLNALADELLNTDDSAPELTQTQEPVGSLPQETQKQPSIYENYAIMGGLEKIQELDDEHNETVVIDKKKQSKKKPAA
jgi:hypothetical protein